ncbi:helix-turn-helix domain-containing protein [Zobellia roscoffensis]|uniref:helix-turn-helix domain-containing protein n=1 Tax=Zobellia roscoffensis TaxID=2779508 RepID=UPI00188CF66C|nr:helix-turn-helix domain-containing protein [Zobellia roscoffensis]
MSKNLSKGSKATPSQGGLIDKLRKEIELNLNNDQFGVDSLAQAVGMSRSSLHRKLHKVLGISTSQFIREYRLKRALKILQEEDITASETAYRVGFSSSTYFNTCFHKYHGYTPGEVKSRSIEDSVVVEEQFAVVNNNSSRLKYILWIVFPLPLILLAVFLYNTKPTEERQTSVVEKATGTKSIAVLPLKNWTGNPDLEYVSDGMTDAIISRLTKVSAIDKIIPLSSTVKFKETDLTASEMAADLGVTNLLQGNLQISGDQIKINLQLIHGESDEHIWSREYTKEWKSDEIFDLQTEVVEDIAASMNAEISENELKLVKKIPTNSKQAYSYYLQGEFQRSKANELTYSNALVLYEKAIAIDSTFVEAYVGLANIWSFGGLIWGIYSEQEAWGKAKHLLEKAYEIDPANRELEEELYTGYFYFDWNFETVENYYQHILENYFHNTTPAISADYAIKTGRYEEAIKSLEEGILIDPTIGVFFFFKAEALMLMGKTEEAFNLIARQDLLYNDNLFYLRESTKLYYYLREYEKSKNGLNKLLTQFTDYPPILMWLNAVFAQIDGNTEAISKHLAELHAKYENGSSGSPAWFIALYYAHTKDYESTFEWLQKSYDRHEVEMTWLREEPLLAPIRNDSRYKDLYENVGFSSIGLPIKSSLKN